jgi:catechol 2,3-dioxygenase-like lactoylglutathione lyase family enzyme
MEGFVAQKLNDFERGKISRRGLIETLTLAATTAYAADAKAQSPSPLKAQLINHMSYTCPNFKQAADWYAKVFNIDLVGETKRDVVAVFGKKGEKPLGVTADDVPHSHLVIRTPDPNAQPRGGARTRPAPQAVIDHICYTVADFNQARAKAALTAMDVKNVREAGGTTSLHFDDPFGYDVQVSGLESTALTGG